MRSGRFISGKATYDKRDEVCWDYGLEAYRKARLRHQVEQLTKKEKDPTYKEKKWTDAAWFKGAYWADGDKDDLKGMKSSTFTNQKMARWEEATFTVKPAAPKGSRLLNTKEEKIVVELILRMAEEHDWAEPWMLCAWASAIVAAKGGKVRGKGVGPRFVKGFLRRHPEVTTVLESSKSRVKLTECR